MKTYYIHVTLKRNQQYHLNILNKKMIKDTFKLLYILTYVLNE